MQISPQAIWGISTATYWYIGLHSKRSVSSKLRGLFKTRLFRPDICLNLALLGPAVGRENSVMTDVSKILPALNVFLSGLFKTLLFRPDICLNLFTRWALSGNTSCFCSQGYLLLKKDGPRYFRHLKLIVRDNHLFLILICQVKSGELRRLSEFFFIVAMQISPQAIWGISTATYW